MAAMSGYVQRGGSGFKIIPDCEDDVEDTGSLYTCSVKVEYYKSYDYCLKWKTSMYRCHSSQQQTVEDAGEDNHQRRLRGRTRREKQGNHEDPSKTSVQNDGESDILDLIDSCHSQQQSLKHCTIPQLGDQKHKKDDSPVHAHIKGEAEPANSVDSSHTLRDEGLSVEVTGEDWDNSKEDCASVCSSVVSGPSLLSPRRQRFSQFLCGMCRKVYQKAKKMKTPIKDKLLDHDPKSLSCDQWVLLKKWKPSRLTGRRNVRKVKKPPIKRTSRSKRKRKGGDSHSHHVSKLQRLHANDHPQHIGIDCTDNSLSGVMEASSVQTNPQQKKGFREQLMLLRSSTIVSETHSCDRSSSNCL